MIVEALFCGLMVFLERCWSAALTSGWRGW